MSDELMDEPLKMQEGVRLGFDEYGRLAALIALRDDHAVEVRLDRAQFMGLRDAITAGLARGNQRVDAG